MNVSRRTRTRASLAVSNLAQSSRLCLFVNSLLCLQCGGKTSAPESQTVTPSSACSSQLGSKPIAHACTHTTNGPFENVVAGVSESAAPKVDSIHVAYLIEISESQSDAFVAFTPSRDGEHLLLLDREVPFVVSNGSEQERPVFSDALEGCDTASYGEVYDLAAGEPYTIEFEANAHSPTLLFFEHLATFGNGAWQEACPDGE